MTGLSSKKSIAFALVPLLFLVMLVIIVCITNRGGKASSTAASTSKLRFDPDREKDSINFYQLAKISGPVPDARKRYRIGAVLKFFGNRYWQLMADGMQFRADELKMEIDVRAAASDSDPDGQLAILEEMIGEGYDALLLSPQTDKNLLRAVRKARKAGILIINVNDAVLEDAEHWVGPNQYENGVRAAGYVIRSMPQGGKVAVIRGLGGVYSVKQRTRGFTDSLKGTGIEAVASTDCSWICRRLSRPLLK
jgi:ribose transport system substrate-binding protein